MSKKISKFMNIEMTEAFSRDSTYLYADDCPNIIKKVNDIHGEITDEDLANAIDVIIGAFVKRKAYSMVIDIDERDTEYAPAKEMTLEEIEKKLGYKVKIVNDKQKRGTKMNKMEWAEREVEIACKKENPDRKEGEWDYDS